MSFLHVLHSEISVSILTEWCDVIALSLFDTALSDSTQRAILINQLICLPLFVVQQTDHSEADTKPFLKWTIARSIKLSSLSLSQRHFNQLLFGLISQLDLSQTREIVFDFDNTTMVALQKRNFANFCNTICPVLEKIKIDARRSNPVSSLDSFLNELSVNALAKLKTIDVNTKKCISSKSLAHLSSSCHNLLIFSLKAENSLFDNEALMTLLENNSKLQKFHIVCSDKEKRYDGTPILAKILQCNPQMRSIYLHNCQPYSMSLVLECIKTLTNLQFLYIPKTNSVQGLCGGVYYKIANGCKTLQLTSMDAFSAKNYISMETIFKTILCCDEIKLVNCEGLTDFIIGLIAENNTKISSFIVDKCGSNFTYSAVQQLISKHKSTLTKCSVSGNFTFTDAEILELAFICNTAK